jgi:hypothetical protein
MGNRRRIPVSLNAWILVAPIAVWLFYELLTPVFERAAQIK